MKLKIKQKSPYLFEFGVAGLLIILAIIEFIRYKKFDTIVITLLFATIVFGFIGFYKYKTKISENIIDVENFEVIEEPIEKDNLDEFKTIKLSNLNAAENSDSESGGK